MSDTPRTDACHNGRRELYLGGTVDYAFAQQLECELNEANADRLRLREALDKVAHCDDLVYCGEDDGPELFRRLRFAVNTAEDALTAPPPPVVAKADADALADVIEDIWKNHLFGSQEHAQDKCSTSLKTYRTKYKEGA